MAGVAASDGPGKDRPKRRATAASGQRGKNQSFCSRLPMFQPSAAARNNSTSGKRKFRDGSGMASNGSDAESTDGISAKTEAFGEYV